MLLLEAANPCFLGSNFDQLPAGTRQQQHREGSSGNTERADESPALGSQSHVRRHLVCCVELLLVRGGYRHSPEARCDAYSQQQVPPWRRQRVTRHKVRGRRRSVPLPLPTQHRLLCNLRVTFPTPSCRAAGGGSHHAGCVRAAVQRGEAPCQGRRGAWAQCCCCCCCCCCHHDAVGTHPLPTTTRAATPGSMPRHCVRRGGTYHCRGSRCRRW